MTVLRIGTAAAALATAMFAPAIGRAPDPSSRDCTVTRILADGRTVRSAAPAGAADAAVVRRGNGGGSAVASSRSSGRASASASSSSSVSSSSGPGGHSSARAMSSYTDEDGNLVTVTRDERGCTIEIDERD